MNLPTKISAKKSLGQNFLKCGWALQAILGAADIKEGETIVEIGPGKGILTASLLQKGAGVHVVCVEKDDRLIPFLREKFHQEILDKRLTLIHGDILDSQIQTELFEKIDTYKLVANIPYYITGQLLEQFLSSQKQPQKMVLMLQKEVAKRIVSSDKKESILSISVKAYGVPKKIADVPRSCFSPAPDVDSAILEISNISKKVFIDVSEREFFEIVKTGFAHKRKILAGNLKEKYAAEKIAAAYEKINLTPKIRAENITVEQWEALTRSIMAKLQ